MRNMKYVALIRATNMNIAGQWHIPGTDENRYRSPLMNDKESAQAWLTTILNDYPDSTGDNGRRKYDMYFIKTAIIAFDEEESENFEMFLKDYSEK